MLTAFTPACQCLIRLGNIKINREYRHQTSICNINIACIFLSLYYRKGNILLHCAILIVPNDNFVCHCILTTGFMNFYCRKYCQINCLRTIFYYHNVDLSPSNHIIVASKFLCNIAIIALHDLSNNHQQKISPNTSVLQWYQDFKIKAISLAIITRT